MVTLIAGALGTRAAHRAWQGVTQIELWNIEKSFRMAKSDLQARPACHRKRDSIEAHLTIVFAAVNGIANVPDLKSGVSRARHGSSR